MNGINHIAQFFKKTWMEIITLIVVDLFLLGVLIAVYGISTQPIALFLLFLFLMLVIIHSYQKKFESLGLGLPQHGKHLLFIKACLPYILQTIFFAECSMLIGWILLNLKKKGH